MVHQRATVRRHRILRRLGRERRHRAYRQDISVKNRRFAPSWFVSPETHQLVTPFRENTFRLIYYLAKREVGLLFDSASVSTWTAPDEPDSTIVILNIRAHTDRERLKRTRHAILLKIASKARSWSDAERADYSKSVYFELEEAD